MSATALHRRRAARRVSGERGAAAVEFALVSLVLFPLLFVMIALSMAFFQLQAGSHGAREGARLAAVGIGTGVPGDNDCATFVSTVKNRAFGITFVSLAMSYPNGATTGQEVDVTITHTISMSILGFIPGVPQTLTAHATGKARIEHVDTVTTPCSG